MTRLVVCIAPHGSGEKLAAAATAAGVGGGTLLRAQGTASTSVLQLLGLGGSSREMLLCAVPADLEEPVIDALRHFAEGRRRFGVAFSTDAHGFFRFGNNDNPQERGERQSNGKDDTMKEPENELVCFIVNKGYAEDAMAAARTAGAGGGTILPARGTAKPGDETFLGVPLVPEKEMLLVVVPAERAEDVCAKVRALPCLSSPGSGIAFRVPVRMFAPLGA